MNQHCKHRFTFALVLVGCRLSSAALALVPTKDLPGAKDGPLISRYPGSIIIGFHVLDFDQALLPAGKFSDKQGKFTKVETLAGKITVLACEMPKHKSAFAVYHNYKQQALARRGIKVSRMRAEGVASFAPVAGNRSAHGRAKNRRVELVAQ